MSSQLEGCDAICGGYWNNFDVMAGKQVGDDFEISYQMPEITGKYYLVVIADAFDAIAEANEDNNFFFITAENAKPLEFVNGVITNKTKAYSLKATKLPSQFENTENQTVVKNGNLNAYSPAEVSRLLLSDKKSGKLQSKIDDYRLKSATLPATKKIVRP